MTESIKKGKQIFFSITAFHIINIIVNFFLKGISLSIGSIITLIILYFIYKGSDIAVEVYIGRFILSIIIMIGAFLFLFWQVGNDPLSKIMNPDFSPDYNKILIKILPTFIILSIMIAIEIIIIYNLKKNKNFIAFHQNQKKQKIPTEKN